MLQKAQRYKNGIEEIEHVLRCIMPERRNYQGNQNSTSRRYHLYRHKDNDSFRSGEIQVSGYGGLSCDLTFHDVSVEKTIKILALLDED